MTARPGKPCKPPYGETKRARGKRAAKVTANAERKTRLGQALRDNLRRRKKQDRARGGGGG